MSFEDITQENILQIVNWLNNLPKKSLDWKTACKVFYNFEKNYKIFYLCTEVVTMF